MGHDILGDDVTNISSGDSAGGDLNGSYPNPDVGTVLGGKIPLTRTTTLRLPTRAVDSASVITFVVATNDFWANVNTTTAAVSATLPTAASVPNAIYAFRASGGNALTIHPGGSEKIDGNATKAITNAFTILISDGANWFTLVS